MMVPTTLISLLLGVLPGRTLSSRISFFSDRDCADFKHDIQGPNGYPDGDCSVLEANGNYSSFKVVKLDRGCDGRSMGPDPRRTRLRRSDSHDLRPKYHAGHMVPPAAKSLLVKYMI